MTRRLSRLDAASVALIALTAVLGIALWPRLPSRVAIHFSASGVPGNYVSRPIAVFGMPVVMVATVLFLRGVARVDPPTDRRSFDVIVCSTVFLLAVVQSFALAWNLGYRIPFAVLSLVRVRRGIRTDHRRARSVNPNPLVSPTHGALLGDSSVPATVIIGAGRVAFARDFSPVTAPPPTHSGRVNVGSNNCADPGAGSPSVRL